MTALAADRGVERSGADVLPKHGAHPAKASVLIYKHALVVSNAGYAAPGTTATGLITLGIAVKQCDNSSGGNAAKTVEYETGVFDFANQGGDAVLVTDVGKDVYIVDDQTVARTDGSSSRSRAGKMVKLENGRVFVLVGIGV